MAKIALLVGVSDYQPGFDPLPSAIADVGAMQRVLANPEIGGFKVTLLTNPNPQAFREAIYDLFADRTKEDLLLFYFSGHGVTDQNRNLYLATPQTSNSKKGIIKRPTALAASYLQAEMSESQSQYQVIILDCCYSGAIAKGLTPKDDGKVDIQAKLGGKGRAILTSSTSVQSSFQQEEALSIYTHYLVEGIETGAADFDGDGWISADELHQYASQKVQKASSAMTPKMYPVEEGYNIYVVRSPQDDPKLKYRKAVEQVVAEDRGDINFRMGLFHVADRSYLDTLQAQLGIFSSQETREIELEVIRLYSKHQANLQRYEEVFYETIQQYSPLRETDRRKLKRLQEALELRDEDVAAIHTKIAPLKNTHQSLRSFRKDREAVFKSHILELAAFHASTFQDAVKPQKQSLSPEPKLEPSEVERLSEKGVDYTQLHDLLVAGKWKEADQETAQVMLKAADRSRKGWLNEEDIDNFSCVDLCMIDQLWVKYSQGNFGFSVQAKIYKSLGVGGSREYDRGIWEAFGHRIGWKRNGKWIGHESLIFNITAPVAHLPSLDWAELFSTPSSLAEYLAGREMLCSIFSRVEACYLRILGR